MERAQGCRSQEEKRFSMSKGRAALVELAEHYPQLYVAPADNEETLAAYRLACTRGVAPEGANLDHFVTSEEDELRAIDTPAGDVETIFLKVRADFETLLQVIGHKCSPVGIAPTIGAMTYRGMADWAAVKAARLAYLAGGGDDWGAEFARLAKQPGAFRGELIVISEGPYSSISADETPYDEQEWIRVSREIRLNHECAHVVCRRKMPGDILKIWDEVTADVVGLLCATGEYNAELAARFLGVTAKGYADGRLIEYLDDEQKARIDEVAVEVYGALCEIERQARDKGAADAPFDYLLELKAQPLVNY